MRFSLKLLSVSLGIVLLAAALSTAQTPTEPEKEFRSIGGHFGILLPQQYADYRPAVSLQLPDTQFFVSIYKWSTPAGQFSVAYGISSDDVEANGRANRILAQVRASSQFAQPTGNILGERQTALDGHPGFESITATVDAYSVTQFFVVGDRIYIVSMSLNSTQRLSPQAALTAFNSFRLLPAEVLAAEVSNYIDKFAPEPLPQEPVIDRPTTDVHDEGLKGRVRKVSLDKQYYSGNSLIGQRAGPVSELEFNERGALIKSVEYVGDLPDAVIVYGYLNGERAARISIKTPILTLVSNNPKAKNTPHPRGDRKIELLKLAYKYNAAGQLIEKRVVLSDGTDYERTSYDPKSRKMQHTGGSLLGKFFGGKETYSLDENGVPVQRDYVTKDSAYYKYNVGGHSEEGYRDVTSPVTDRYAYEFDSHGNWIKCVVTTTRMEKGKPVSAPQSVTYRTITYY